MERFDSLTHALDAYITRPNTPYAVMINGCWGVGKTHFLFNSLFPNHQSCVFHYLSLYGLKSAHEIRQQIDQKLSSTPSSSALKQVVCLDDLERWHGDIDYCLSYVNQLVEHQNCKCILIGNLQELTSDNITAFSCAQEKTIRYVYQFSPPMKEILDIAMKLVEYRSLASRRFIRSIIKAHAETLLRFLTSISMRNIRVITEAMQLYDVIYRHHAGALKASQGLAFTYFMSLFSVIVLAKRSSLEVSERKKLLEDDHESNKGFKFLSEVGYFDKELSVRLNSESRTLLDTMFYRLDKISLRGICSIVKNGYYQKDDFEGEFSQWIDEKHYEVYLDREQYYELENEAALTVFQQALDSFITRREVTNPVTLLLLAERTVEDIANGAVDYDPVLFRKLVVETVDKLYENGEMETVELNLFDLAGERFRNCKSIYNYIIKRNNDRMVIVSNSEKTGFWQKLGEKQEPLESLIDRFLPKSVLCEFVNNEEVFECLESLNNSQLNRLVNWFTDGLGNSECCENSVEIKNVTDLSRLLIRKHGYSVGIRANHFRRLAQVLNSSRIIEKAG